MAGSGYSEAVQLQDHHLTALYTALPWLEQLCQIVETIALCESVDVGGRIEGNLRTQGKGNRGGRNGRPLLCCHAECLPALLASSRLKDEGRPTESL